MPVNSIAAVADAALAGVVEERAARDAELSAAQRRVAQIDENRRIGRDELTEVPLIGQMTEEAMFARCVLVMQKGSPIVVLPAPGDCSRARVLDLSTFVEAYRASIRTVTENGQVRSRQLTAVWRDSPSRIVVSSIVVALGRPRFVQDHAGNTAVNLWTPRARRQPTNWEELVRVFLDHVAFLVPDPEERARFLDWLAHAEQRPEILPHYGYLFWTRAFGVGRNWLSSVLTRVWRGEVAASLDLHNLLTSGFNGAIGGGIRCAIADEIRMGGSIASTYDLEQRWRQMMTAEQHTINPKYGHQFVEKNCVRWLNFSNHEDGLRLSREDRRIAVVENPAQPRSPDYYTAIYAALHDPDFIDSVAWFLHTRDISRFNPGALPALNAAKLAVIEATTPQLERDLAELLEEWQAPVAASSDLTALLEIAAADQARKRHLGLALARAGWRNFGAKVRIARGGGTSRLRVWVRDGYTAESAGAVADAVNEYRASAWFAALSRPHGGDGDGF
ncbi:MAG: DUF5906 domain-containing protein [Burkholderiaceae bacterium]|jgi:hypothetical protein|nr:DUF5906 domain-containing protein [Burkholderiaceae bacterium]